MWRLIGVSTGCGELSPDVWPERVSSPQCAETYLRNERKIGQAEEVRSRCLGCSRYDRKGKTGKGGWS